MSASSSALLLPPVSPAMPLRLALSQRLAKVATLALLASVAFAPAEAKEPVKQFGGVPYETIPSPRMQTTPNDAMTTRRVDLSVGKSFVLDLPQDAGEVFVADPKVANAVVRTPRKIFVIGTGQGTTSVFVLDKNGQQIASLDIGVAKELARELSILREVIKKALPKADIKVASVGDNFVLSGTVDSALEVQSAIDIANNLVGTSGGFMGIGGSAGKVVNALQVRGRDQVMLKVTIAEVQRSVLKQLGMNFDGQWKVADSMLSVVSENPFSVQKAGLLSDTLLTANLNGKKSTLRALERQGVLRTLAEPTLTAISGESAKFLAGGEVAIPKSETCDAVTRACTVSVDYKPIGVTLNFTPVVMSENRISIRLATEVAEIDPDSAYKLTNIVVPGFRTRKAETTVELPSGAVLATAGLIQQQSRQAINGLPGAMNIPILGTMFRSRDYQRFETELLILVQPFIAKPSTPGQISKPDDGFSDATDPSSIFMGKLNRTYGNTAKTNAGPIGFIND